MPRYLLVRPTYWSSFVLFCFLFTDQEFNLGSDYKTLGHPMTNTQQTKAFDRFANTSKLTALVNYSSLQTRYIIDAENIEGQVL